MRAPPGAEVRQETMTKPIRFLVFFLTAALAAAGASAQPPVLPKVSDDIEKNSALLAVPRPAAPAPPGLPDPKEDLVITSELGKTESAPVMITNQAEIDLALEQLTQVHGLSRVTAAAIQEAYEAALAGSSTGDGSVAVPIGPDTPQNTAELVTYLSQNTKDSVPELHENYAEDALGDELDPITLNRRNAEGVPNASLVIRRYADYILKKYDTNHDGKLQREEWASMPGRPQSFDLNGDFVLEDYEILYHLAAYAKGRTVTHPVPPRRLNAAQTALKTDGPILIHPISAPIRKAAADEEKIDPSQKPADISPEEFTRIVTDADQGIGTEEEPALFGILTQESGASAATVREFAPSANETAGIPRWFLARDANGDGQLTLREFSPSLSLESTAFFGRLDTDSDGLVTPDEVREYPEKGPRPKVKAAE